MHDHSHCWESENPPCGQKIKHFECCLCKKEHPEIKIVSSPKDSFEEENELESLSEKIHHLYCTQYEKDHGEPYWTKGDYSKLEERVKEYDRNIARFVLNARSEERAAVVAALEKELPEEATAFAYTRKGAQSFNSCLRIVRESLERIKKNK